MEFLQDYYCLLWREFPVLTLTIYRILCPKMAKKRENSKFGFVPIEKASEVKLVR